MTRIISKFSLLLVFFFMLAETTLAETRLSVFVSIVPQKYFVEQIGRDLIEIHVMVPPGASPATYEPKPRQMIALSRANAYFAVGVPFERAWLKKLASVNPAMMIFHTDEDIRKLPMKTNSNYEDTEKLHKQKKKSRQRGLGKEEDPFAGKKRYDNPEEGNKNSGYRGIPDPHIWLSPLLVLKQTRAILNALCKLDPQYRLVYESNFRNFSSRVKELDDDLKQTLQGKEIQFMVFHPAWGYFAHDYGLRQIPIEIEGKDPKPAELKRLIEYARERKIKVIFVQPQLSSTSAQVIAGEIGAQIAYADPLAPDWMANLREVANKFMGALR